MTAATETTTARDVEAKRLGWTVIDVVKDGIEQQVCIVKRQRPTYDTLPYHVTVWTHATESFSHSVYDLNLAAAAEVANRRQILMAHWK